MNFWQNVIQVGVLMMSVILTGCTSNVTKEPISFGAAYRLVQTASSPALVADSLRVTVAYSGCGGDKEFVLHHRTVNASTVELWLHKVSPDEFCEAFFEEPRVMQLPKGISPDQTIILLGPFDTKVVLRR